MPTKPDNRSPFEKSIMAVAKNCGDFFASTMDMKINEWFLERFGRLPSNEEIMQKAVLAVHQDGERTEAGPLKGTVFAWDGECIMNFVFDAPNGTMYSGKVPPDFVPIIPKNVLT